MPAKTYPNDTHASPHFTWGELDWLDRCPAEHKANLARLAKVLEVIRAHFGGKPVTVTSGYRPASVQDRLYREAVARYGAAHASKYVAPPGHSQHEKGTAADIVIEGVDPLAVFKYAVHVPGVGGVGYYGPNHGSFTHVDVRPLGADGAVDRW